jgi:hypothetical protein
MLTRTYQPYKNVGELPSLLTISVQAGEMRLHRRFYLILVYGKVFIIYGRRMGMPRSAIATRQTLEVRPVSP